MPKVTTSEWQNQNLNTDLDFSSTKPMEFSLCLTHHLTFIHAVPWSGSTLLSLHLASFSLFFESQPKCCNDNVYHLLSAFQAPCSALDLPCLIYTILSPCSFHSLRIVLYLPCAKRVSLSSLVPKRLTTSLLWLSTSNCQFQICLFHCTRCSRKTRNRCYSTFHPTLESPSMWQIFNKWKRVDRRVGDQETEIH